MASMFSHSLWIIQERLLTASEQLCMQSHPLLLQWTPEMELIALSWGPHGTYHNSIQWERGKSIGITIMWNTYTVFWIGAIRSPMGVNHCLIKEQSVCKTPQSVWRTPLTAGSLIILHQGYIGTPHFNCVYYPAGLDLSKVLLPREDIYYHITHTVMGLFPCGIY